MTFRARTIGAEGRFGSPLTIAGYELTGEAKTFIGEPDEELGFGVPPIELCEAPGVVVETLEGQAWPGSQSDTNKAMLHAFRDGVWPGEGELVLQANVTAKIDPQTRAGVLKQHFVRQGNSEEAADKLHERHLRPGLGAKLLDGVKPIATRPRPTRALPVATGKPAGKAAPARAPKAAPVADTDDDSGEEGETPAEAQARREAEASAPAQKPPKAPREPKGPRPPRAPR